MRFCLQIIVAVAAAAVALLRIKTPATCHIAKMYSFAMGDPFIRELCPWKPSVPIDFGVVDATIAHLTGNQDCRTLTFAVKHQLKHNVQKLLMGPFTSLESFERVTEWVKVACSVMDYVDTKCCCIP